MTTPTSRANAVLQAKVEQIDHLQTSLKEQVSGNAELNARIAAMRKEREGFVLVPREPTNSMCNAGGNAAWNCIDRAFYAARVYRAMLDAAEKEPK